MHSNTVRYIRNLFRSTGAVPLHAPRFVGNEKNYLGSCIESMEVSSEGEYVERFEGMVNEYCGSRYAVAFNSTESAMRVALVLAGTGPDCEVLTQPLAHAMTANTVDSFGAEPIFIDVERKTMGMDPDRLREFLAYNTELREGGCFNRHTRRRITACVPVHTLGFPCRIDDIRTVCDEYGIMLIEDASEAFGSAYKGTMAGRFGRCGIYGFEGHKIATCGDGGVLVCDDEAMAAQARSVGTIPYLSDAQGADQGRFSSRMSNLNAAVGCAQMEHIRTIVTKQRDLTRRYREFFSEYEEDEELQLFRMKKQSEPNCWLNALLFEAPEDRDAFLEATNAEGVAARALWPLISDLPRFSECAGTDADNARWLQKRIATLPSGVR
ncbi:DegT/DnrJ/EryC1/StrS aminotransferase family protein [Sulfurimonas sp. HSL-3221]|uniref:DegT/DnrJ/EryC1/StrS family aminotransferase n=1 Tax=Thiomicrolovo sulfuroxydans TaxID=2894755 RepID=UPI001E4C441B|nr:DegT/DnrJ/EryC1/StrS aminotransferase family protein [Sulfurimonas sp. HSL-3221]UFS61739.1 DegT/DnrJ/EryC1/StrS aminotransferase family protein [Sulfurimonas sp. HSL-3221]